MTIDRRKLLQGTAALAATATLATLASKLKGLAKSRVLAVASAVAIVALLAVSGPAIGVALYADARVGDHLPLLALGVLFSCWQTLCAAILSGVGRQGAAAGIALAADGVQLVLTCLLVSGRGMQGYAFAFTLSAVLGAALNGIEDGNLEDKYRWEQGFTLQAYTCPDSAETRRAFVEKRETKF